MGRFVNVLSESEKRKGFETLGTVVFHNFNANLLASRFIYVLSITVKSAKNLIHWVHFPTNFMKIYQQAGL